eukprot:466334_1
MAAGHRYCNNKKKDWYKYSTFCKAKTKKYKSNTFMVKGEAHAYPSSIAFCERILEVLIGHYFTDKQIKSIVKAWHSNSNESLHSTIYTKVDKDKKCNYEDYKSGCNSAICDWNKTHEESIHDRYDSMGVPVYKTQKKACAKRTVSGEKRKTYQGRESVKNNRKEKRHRKNNTDNSYSSGNHTI